MNTLVAGNGGDNVLLAGPNGDSLTGNLSGNDTFVAGAGNDTITGGLGANVFMWQEGDGNPNITASASNNTLQALGFTAADQFEARAKAGTLSVGVSIPSSGGPPVQRTLQATGIQTLTLDDGSGGTMYQVDDLAGTTVRQVNLNLHEVGNPTGAADQITVNGSPNVANTVDVSADPNVLAGNSYSYDSSGNPIPSQPVYGQATKVDLKIASDDIGPNGGAPPAHYVITAAIPKAMPNNTDQLFVNTGKADDTVSVESTQGAISDNTVSAGNGQPPNLGGSVTVNTVGGDNTINVGTATPAAGAGLLDRIQGNLYIDAGTGTNNLLNLDESGATNADTLALTASLAGSLAYQLLRYQGEDLSSNPDGGGGVVGQPGEKNRYPMLIQYGVDAGGGYGGGINLYLPRPLTQSPNTLYVTDTFPLAQTTVYTDGKVFVGQQTDQIIVGFNPLDANNPAHSPETSMLSNTQGMPDNLLGPLDIEGTDWTHDAVGGVNLAVYDEAAAANSSYTLTNNSIDRFGLTPITYNDLGISTVPGSVALFAANAANSIAVQSTAAYTPAAVDTGRATSGIHVGFPVLPQQYVLDAVQGALTVIGGGTANLTMNDAVNVSGGTYNLNATTLQRLGGVAIAPITFNKMTTVDLYEAAQANNIANVSGTAAGTTVTVHTGDGTDDLTVSGLDQILGPLGFLWKSGTKNMVADDTSAASVDTYSVAPFVLKRSGAADITYDPLATLQLDTSSVQDANVNIPGIDSGMQESIFAGAGANIITVASGGENLNTVQGGLDVHGGANTDLLLEDQNAATARSYTLTAGELQAASHPPQPPMIAPVDFVNLSALTLDSGNQGSTTNVDGTAAGNHVTVNARTNDAITIANATGSLTSIVGRVDVLGVGTGDNLTIVDTQGNPMSPYTLSASEIDHPGGAPIGYQGLAHLLLEGSNSGDVYRLNSVPASTSLQIAATGTSNTLYGPNTDNTWEFKPGVYLVDTNASFSGIQGIVGGSGDDTFKYEGSTFNGTIDGGGGHNKLATGADQFETVTLERGSVSNNGFYGWIHSAADTFDEIDSIVSLAGDGSTLNGSSPNFTGDFTGTLNVSGFDSFSLDVPGNFSGSLLASTEGTAANPIGPITVGGSLTNTGVIKVGFLNSFLVTAGDMAGTLKGFGVDSKTLTIQTISIGGSMTATSEIISAGAMGVPTVGGNMGGLVLELTPPGVDMQKLIVGGSLTGTVDAGSIGELSVGQDLTGQVNVSGAIGRMSVGGNLSGSVTAANIGAVKVDGSQTGKISAGQIASIGVMRATGPVPLDVTQNGVEYYVLVKGGSGDTFAIFYDGQHGATPPEAHVRVNPQPLPPHPPNPCDVYLLVNGSGKFDLARLDAAGPNGQPAPADVRDVVVEGDVLPTDSPAALSFFNLPTNAPGGVQLPLDDLGSVAATDNMAAGTVVAHTLQGLAFGSVTKPDGTTVLAPDAQENDTAIIAILIGLPLPPIETSMTVPVSRRGPVALFVHTNADASHAAENQLFDKNDLLFSNQATMLPPQPFNADPIYLGIVQVQSSAALGSGAPSAIQSIAFEGDGGSLTTAQPITRSITSTGPLGNVVLESPQGLVANITAPSIFGNILVPNGPIAGTLQTTGIRTDPANGATTPIPADLGRLTDANGSPTGTTRIVAGEGITGRIISRGDLVSQIVARGGIDGVIAVQGNLGAVERNPDGSVAIGSDGTLTRFGGVEADGGYRGILIGLGNAFGDIEIQGGLSGRIAFQGQVVAGLDASRIGILGNVDIHGPVRRHGAIVSGGEIGDAAGGTEPSMAGGEVPDVGASAIRKASGSNLSTSAIQGTIAALGNINLARGKTDDAQFFGAGLTGANAATVEAIFAVKSFDLDPAALDLKGLDRMLASLAALNLAPDGGDPPTPTQDYVAAVYVDLLGRETDGGGLNYWSSQLAGGAPRARIAGQLTHSDEYFAGIVTPTYEDFLGRAPDTGGLQYWIAQMRQGLTNEQIEARFIGSPEFFSHSGGTDKSWVDAMYQDLLGRPADPQGESYWVSQLPAGADRTGVAYGFAASLERERQRIAGDYLQYLGRLPDAAGVDYWVSQFAQGLTNEAVITGFLASDEYFEANT